MVIKRAQGSFVKSTIASGQTISAGNFVGLSNGEAVLSDNSTNTETIGVAKYVEGSTIIIQTSGKFSNSTSGSEYWLSTSGSITNIIPTSGIVQKVATRLDSQNILIDIDKTVIIL